MNANVLLAVAFITVGLAGTLLMYHLWGYPYDAKRHVSAAPRGLTMVHRLLGLAFVAIYVTMLIRMMPRLWTYEGELAARTVLHVALACLIGVLLILKIAIIRWARHLGNALPWLGSAVLVCAVVMLVMPLSLAARTWWIARGATAPDAMERLAMAMAADPDAFPVFMEPAGMVSAGRTLLETHCLQCHDVRRIIRDRRQPGDWISLVDRMRRHALARRAIPDADARRITAFLVAALGRDAASVGETRRLPAAPPQALMPRLSGDAMSDAARAASNGSPGHRIDPFADVRAILDAHCIVCHSGVRAPKGARFETLEQILGARSDGPAVVIPGDPDASELYRRVAGLSTPRMPITGPPWLSDSEIAAIRSWIADGAAGLEPVAEPPATVRDAGASPGARDPAPRRSPDRPEPPDAPGPPPVVGVTFAQVRPILAVHCMRCHTTDGVLGAAPEGLRLTDLPSVVAPRERPVVIAGHPEASLLLRHVRGLEQPRMPFDGPPWLTEEEIDTLTEWIRAGARDETGRPATVPVGREVRLEGVLTTMWTIDGAPFQTAPGCEVRDARIGGPVEVRAIVQSDGSLLARRVRGR